MKNVKSTFDKDADGWTVASSDGDSGRWTESGGHPGGYFATTGVGGSASCLAPDKFLGNDKAFYGGKLSYDCEDAHSDGKATKLPALVLYDGKDTLFGFASTPVGKDWTHETIKLDVSDLYVYNSQTEKLTHASSGEVEKVLSHLTLLEIVQPFTGNGKDTGGLDNVLLAEAKHGSLAGPDHLDLHPVLAPLHGAEHLAIA